MDVQVGDRVAVQDEALVKLKRIVPGVVANQGIVDRITLDGDAIIHFDDGMAAPYPLSEIVVLETYPSGDQD